MVDIVKVDVTVEEDINKISAEITNPDVIETIVKRAEAAAEANAGGKPQTRKRRHQKKGGRKSNASKRQRKSKKSVRRK